MYFSVRRDKLRGRRAAAVFAVERVLKLWSWCRMCNSELVLVESFDLKFMSGIECDVPSISLKWMRAKEPIQFLLKWITFSLFSWCERKTLASDGIIWQLELFYFTSAFFLADLFLLSDNFFFIRSAMPPHTNVFFFFNDLALGCQQRVALLIEDFLNYTQIWHLTKHKRRIMQLIPLSSWAFFSLLVKCTAYEPGIRHLWNGWLLFTFVSFHLYSQWLRLKRLCTQRPVPPTRAFFRRQKLKLEIWQKRMCAANSVGINWIAPACSNRKQFAAHRIIGYNSM